MNITDQTFDDEVLKSDIPVLVDFWAPWCGPCRIVEPIVEALASEYRGRVKFVKINVDDNPEKAAFWRVFSIPNLKIYKNGKLVDEIIGAIPKHEIIKVIEKYL